jgi:putative ABC transport system permease protein
MDSIKQTFRRLFRKGEHTATRIISLTAGLAFGILLLAEVLYYFSFDGFYPDANRIYIVHENFKADESSDKTTSYPRVSGAIAPGLKNEVPGIEAATRLNGIGTSVFYTEDKKSYSANFVLADEHLFEVLPRPVISGNPKEILKSPMHCMVSSTIADAIGKNTIGKVIELKEYPGQKLTISGVFKALPENTNYNYDILISMVSTRFFTWDGTQNWLGNDRYYAAVKLAPGVTPKSLAPAVRAMQVKNQDIEKLEQQQGGEILKYSFKPIQKMYSDGIKDMAFILTAIAFAVLFVSLLNYTLLTLSSLIKRAKSSAIHKTCGAQSHNLLKLIFSETILLFLISLVGAITTIWLLKPVAEAQLGHKLTSALTASVVGPLALLVIALVFATSYFPGRFFARIPVATAFNNYRQKKNKWKLALLSVQFVGATFILTMLIVVSMQYNKALTTDHGYQTQGVYYGSTSGIEANRVSVLLEELRSIAGVENVGLGSSVPIEGASGNNVKSSDGEKELFNIADFYWIDEDYLSILGIPVSEGEMFSKKNSVVNDLLISEQGAAKLRLINGWDQVVGQDVTISQHGASTVRGIFPDFIINSITSPDIRPAIFHYYSKEKFEQLKTEDPSFSFYVLIKVGEKFQQGMLKKITDTFNQFTPRNDALVKSLEQEQKLIYQSENGFRNTMMAGNAVILLITFIGLIGYTTNEATRRRKELAIRRINGAKVSNILMAFVLDLIYIALPAIAIGLGLAWITANKWMQHFASKVTLHWALFALCCLSILLAIAIIAALNYVRTARRNPVESLRYE